MNEICQFADYKVVDGKPIRVSEFCGKAATRVFKGPLADIPFCQDHENVWKLMHMATKEVKS